MYSSDEISSLYSFLTQTPEGALRKMLVGGEMTDAHFRVLAKLAKGGNEDSFTQAFNSDSFGTMKLSPKEAKVKENFWQVCKAKLNSLGLIGGQKAA